MAINKKLIHFNTKVNFNTQLQSGNILDTSIVFIKETKEIWTHGQLYPCPLSLEEITTLLSKKVDKVTGKSLVSDSEIEKLLGLPNNAELNNLINTAKAAGDNAQSDLNAHKQNKSNPHEVTKAQVGLGNVTNDAQVKRSEMGVANGVATLDADGKVPAAQLPSYVDDIVDVYATYSKSDTGVLSNIVLYSDAAKTKIVTGEAGKIYQNVAAGEPSYQFRYTGTVFAQTGASSLIIGEVAGTAQDGAKGKANTDNLAKVMGTSLSHIKDTDNVTTAADKVSINYECYSGDQYGATGTAHTVDLPVATTEKAGVMSAADKVKLEGVGTAITDEINKLDATATSTDGTNVQVKVTEVDGKVTAVNITKDETAKNADLTAEVTRATTAEGTIQTALENQIEVVYNSTIQTEHGNVGDVVFVDKESEVITAVPKELIKDIDPERYEPIGIVVVPSNHNMYGTEECGIIALHCLSARTPDTGCSGDDAEDIAYGTGVLPDDLPKVEYWNSSGELSEGRNYKDDVWTTNDPDNNPVFPKEKEEGDFSVDRRTRFIADPTLGYKNLGFRKYTSPYDAQLKSNLKYINNVYPHGDSIFSGKAYNKKILDTLVDETWKTASAITDTDFPLIKSAWRYHTIGTKQGDWYVPSVLEIGYLLNRNVTITNSAIELENLYNARFAGSPEPIWSVTACNNPSKAEFVYGQGGAVQEDRANAHFAIAFTTMKLSYTETLKDRLNRLEKRARIPEGGSDQQVLVWDYEGHAKWEDINKVLPLDTISYGVEWDINVADPHLARIGNPELHKTLPIQSKLRGCVAKGSEIQYWLDPEDWNYRADRDRKYAIDAGISSVENSTDLLIRKGMFPLPKVVVGDSVMISVMRPQENNPTEYIHTDLGRGVVIQEYIAEEFPSPSYPQGKPGQPMKVRLDKPIEEGTNTDGTLTFTLVSRLDGYDGTVKVYVPEFYIKSFINGDKRQVRISETRPNSTWTKQPACLVDAYRCTVLNTVPENMGYLSTLPVDSAVSIVNTSTYCRGGGNRSANDAYLETEPFRSDLCKPRTNMSRAIMRTYSRNAGSEILSYDQYKNIFYWLYVIEYANFNCQEAFNSSLTEEGYHQGGMGAGVTTWDGGSLSSYNGHYPLTPCGYLNEFGNGTGIKEMTARTKTFQVPRWRGFDNPFGDIWTNLDGIIIQGDAEGNQQTVYTTTDPNNYGDNESAKNAMEIAGHEIYQSGYTKEFDLGDAAHIIPESVGGDTTKYKCDSHWTASEDTSLRTLFVGGSADNSASAGLGHFYSILGVSSSDAHVGFRSVSLIS